MPLSPAVFCRLLARPASPPPTPLAMLRHDGLFEHPDPDEARIVEPRHTPLGRREFTVLGPIGTAVGGLWLDESLVAPEDLDYLAGLVERARARAKAPHTTHTGLPPRLTVLR